MESWGQMGGWGPESLQSDGGPAVHPIKQIREAGLPAAASSFLDPKPDQAGTSFTWRLETNSGAFSRPSLGRKANSRGKTPQARDGRQEQKRRQSHAVRMLTADGIQCCDFHASSGFASAAASRAGTCPCSHSPDKQTEPEAGEAQTPAHGEEVAPAWPRPAARPPAMPRSASDRPSHAPASQLATCT